MQMKRVATALFAIFAAHASAGKAVEDPNGNPLAKTIQLLGELAAKVKNNGIAEDKAYRGYFEWCDEASKNTQNEITTLTAQKGKLEAQISQLESRISVCTTKIDELVAAIAKAEREVRDATLIRNKERADFEASQAELMDSINMLDRAIAIIERDMAKNPAALAQLDSNKGMGAVLKGLSAIMDAAAFPGSDRQKLIGLIQSHQDSDEDDLEVDAPAAAKYRTHSTSILDTLEDLKDKAEGQLAQLRKEETNAGQNYNLLKGSLQDQIWMDTKDMNAEKAARAAAEENKAQAEGDLRVTNDSLKSAKELLGATQADCIEVSADHEGSIRSRNEELTAITSALKALQDTTGQAEDKTYSLLQVAKSARPGERVVSLVKDLAHKEHSAALSQLASRMSAVFRYSSGSGTDPFKKVKGLIGDLITQLEAQATAEAVQKAYCDEYQAKTEFKIGELEDDVSALTSKIDLAAARSAQLKGEVRELQAELANLAQEQASMDRVRADENAAYLTTRADMKVGIQGVGQALQVLRAYYGGAGSAALAQQAQPAKPEFHKSAAGAGQSIIDILEVVQSDFATNLATVETEEGDAVSTYQKVTQENRVAKATLTQDVRYKSEEFTKLDKSIVDLTGDRAGINKELDAVNDFYKKLMEKCTAVPEGYTERARRRDAEIAGLKQALQVLEDDTVFFQKSHGIQ